MSLNRLVKDELSGVVAKSFVEQIARFHRIQASMMFHEVAEYVKNELVKIGLKDVTIEQFPADGKTNPDYVLKFLRDLERANLITFQ